MSGAHRGRLWWPCDVNFWDHPAVVDAGEPAGVLYQRLVAWAKVNYKDGWVPLRQPRAWYDDWKPRLDALVRVGLVTVGTQNINLVDWDKWHEPNKERLDRVEAKRQADRERQRAKRARDRALLLALEVSEGRSATTKNVIREGSRDSHNASHGVTSDGHDTARWYQQLTSYLGDLAPDPGPWIDKARSQWGHLPPLAAASLLIAHLDPAKARNPAAVIRANLLRGPDQLGPVPLRRPEPEPTGWDAIQQRLHELEAEDHHA